MAAGLERSSRPTRRTAAATCSGRCSSPGRNRARPPDRRKRHCGRSRQRRSSRSRWSKQLVQQFPAPTAPQMPEPQTALMRQGAPGDSAPVEVPFLETCKQPVPSRRTRAMADTCLHFEPRGKPCVAPTLPFQSDCGPSATVIHCTIVAIRGLALAVLFSLSACCLDVISGTREDGGVASGTGVAAVGATGGSSTGISRGSSTTGGTTTGTSLVGPCTGDAQCASGICGVNGTGHCCQAACGSGAPPCGATDCDVQTGACVFPGSSATCGSLVCEGDSLTGAGVCDSAGSCSNQERCSWRVRFLLRPSWPRLLPDTGRAKVRRTPSLSTASPETTVRAAVSAAHPVGPSGAPCNSSRPPEQVPPSSPRQWTVAAEIGDRPRPIRSCSDRAPC